jgi:methylase of polypeptide subunit release factors
MRQVPPADVATINQRVAAARDRLRAADLLPAEADLSARLLAQHLLEWDTAQLLTSGGDNEPHGFAETFGALVARRAARERSITLSATGNSGG